MYDWWKECGRERRKKQVVAGLTQFKIHTSWYRWGWHCRNPCFTLLQPKKEAFGLNQLQVMEWYFGPTSWEALEFCVCKILKQDRCSIKHEGSMIRQICKCRIMGRTHAESKNASTLITIYLSAQKTRHVYDPLDRKSCFNLRVVVEKEWKSRV